MPPRYRIRESAVVELPYQDEPRHKWQLHLIKLPTPYNAILWAHPRVDAGDGGFVVFNWTFNAPLNFYRKDSLGSLKDKSEDISENLLFKYFEKGWLARQFMTNETGNLRQGKQKTHETVVMARHGIGSWDNPAIVGVTQFRWLPEDQQMGSTEFQSISSAEMWARLCDLQNDTEGEVAFARQFAFWGQEERWLRIRQTECGSIEEFIRRTTQLLRGSQLWDQLPRNNEISFCFFADGEIYLQLEDGRNVPAKHADLLFANVRQTRAYFRPFDSRIARFRCVQEEPCPISVSVTRPTKHEQLEAHLCWRDWLNSIQNK